MKPWPSTDRSGPDRAAAGEYVGRTARGGAVQGGRRPRPLGRVALLEDPPGRGRRVLRHRGLRGRLDAPAGSRTRAESSPSQADRRDGASPIARGPPGAPERLAVRARQDGAPDPLTMLAEGTTDQVSIHNGVVSPAAFDALLAEAEAALGQDPALPADTHDTANVDTDDTGVDDTGATTAPPTAPACGRAPHRHSPEPWRIPDLCTRLRALGVPDAYLPPGERPTLDALASAMGTLPASAQRSRTGRCRRDRPRGGWPDLVEPTAALLADELGLGRRDLVRCDVQRDADVNATTTARRQPRTGPRPRSARRYGWRSGARPA